MLPEIANHLWQSTLFLCCIALLCAFLRKEDARVRYWLWWIGSVKFLVPFSLLTSIGDWVSPSVPIELSADWTTSLLIVSGPFVEKTQTWTLSSLLLALWATGACLVLGIWIARANRLRRLVAGAALESKTLIDQGKTIQVYRVDADMEPGVVGLLRPILLLPKGLEEQLSSEQLEAVLAHELCHIRRRDNLTAALHMLVEAVFWFHPLIWWLGYRLIDERERACDEMVVTLGHDREIYAQGILDVCEQYVATRLACAPGISGSDLKRRVVEIMHYKGNKKMENTKKLLLSTLFSLALIIPVLGGLFINPGALAQESKTFELDVRSIELADLVQLVNTTCESSIGAIVVENPDLIIDIADDSVTCEQVAEWIAQIDSGQAPLRAIQPNYPRRAAERGIEGYCVVSFTITTTGETRNHAIEECSSPMFERESIRAAEVLRFMPRTIGGRAVETNHFYRFEYQMADDEEVLL